MNQSVTNRAESSEPKQGYRIVFRGRLLEGEDRGLVEHRLRNELGLSSPQTRAFLSNKKFVIQKNLSRTKAVRYRNKLRNAGLDVVAQAKPLKKHVVHTEQTAPAPELDQLPSTPPQNQPNPAPRGNHLSRWISVVVGAVFTAVVIWLFFSV